VTVLKGLVERVASWTRPGKVEKNVLKIAEALHVSHRIREWLPTA
jgi:hypothetical protein